MYRNLKIVKISSKYCNYLRKSDDKVSYNAGKKELRPFIGILFKIGVNEYFAPLSSPKEKHKKLRNTIDLIKIKNGEYGVVNLNNMIPVLNNCYTEFNLNKKAKNKKEEFRLELMKNQLRWLTSNKKTIYTKSRLLYNLYIKDKLSKNVKERCCNYKLLEEKSKEYKNRIN